MTLEPQRRRGRPEDPALRANVLRAAMNVYAERGWSGFNFETVAKRARVGRPALYRRWENRTELLVEAFRELSPGLTDVDLGGLREDLVRLGHEYAKTMQGSRGIAGTRLMADAHVEPELNRLVTSHVSLRRQELVATSVARAIQRDELPLDYSLEISLLLFGALWERSLMVVAGYQPPATLKDVEVLVDTILGGLTKRDA